MPYAIELSVSTPIRWVEDPLQDSPYGPHWSPVGTAGVTTSTREHTGYLALASELAEAEDLTTRKAEATRVSTQGRLAIGQPIVLLSENFGHTTLNSNIWQVVAATATGTITSGAYHLNGNTTTSNGVRLNTYARFPLYWDQALYCVFSLRLSQQPEVNTSFHAGFMVPVAGGLGVTEGVYFKYGAESTFSAVVNIAGQEITRPVPPPSIMKLHVYKIIVENDRALFYIDGECVAVIGTAAEYGTPVLSSSLGFGVQIANVGTIAPTLGQIVRISWVYIGLQDSGGLGKTDYAVGTKNAAQGQSGGAAGTSALYTNSLATGAGAALTGTTAASSSLGGQISVRPTLTVGSDGLVFSQLTTAPTVAYSGKILYVTGIKVMGTVTTALTGGPVLYAYALVHGSTAVTLVTAESSTAKAYRRIPIGWESYPAAAPVGTRGSTQAVELKLQSPIAVYPGQSIGLTAKNLGTVTTAGIINLQCQLLGYWE